MRHVPFRTLLLAIVASLGATLPAGAQWQNWDAAERAAFYSIDQGSRLIPYDWYRALDKADGSGRFAADGLARFGYLPNSRTPELPVGFTTGKDTAEYGGRIAVGMTCAACHTREVVVAMPGEASPRRVRVDGGPAIADFHAFLTELDAAVRAILVTGGDFDGFARRVLKGSYTPAAAKTLNVDVVAWYVRFGPFMKASLPAQSWGPSRLDAFGMIFNRVAALDLGIEENYRVADAPVRYPFLWNAPRQNKTQWNGAAPNGLYVFGMGRNVGEVYGVFGRLTPTKRDWWVTLNGKNNSVRFEALYDLERLVVKLAPPKYPLPIDAALQSEGERIFGEQCAKCHGKKEVAFPRNSWETPLTPEGTDTRMYDKSLGKMATPVKTGILEGMGLPQWTGRKELGPTAMPLELLANVVGNTLLQELRPFNRGVNDAVRRDLLGVALTNPFDFLSERVQELYGQAEPSSAPAYEARVLEGIWAAAPYLHNGSVPSLWALLQPVEARPKRFFLGSNQLDTKCVGLTADVANDTVCMPTSASTTGLRWEFVVPDGPCPSDNGNGNCGHRWGVNLPDAQKWALIEYLKSL